MTQTNKVSFETILNFNIEFTGDIKKELELIEETEVIGGADNE